MRERVCINCSFKILEPEKASRVSSDGHGWTCKHNWWQDETVCIAPRRYRMSISVRWAENCPTFKRDA